MFVCGGTINGVNGELHFYGETTYSATFWQGDKRRCCIISVVGDDEQRRRAAKDEFAKLLRKGGGLSRGE